jgi:hypothetical protein
MNHNARAFLALTALLLASCARMTTGPRNTWLTRWLGEPVCQPPCWERIRPGETSLSAAATLVEEMPEVTIARQDAASLSFLLNGADTGYIESQAGTVIQIVLHPNASDALPVTDFVGAYGSPAEVRIRRCVEGWCEVDLVYPAQGLIAGLLLPNTGIGENRVRLFASLGVSQIILVQSTVVYESQALSDGPLVAAWKGYTDYP